MLRNKINAFNKKIINKLTKLNIKKRLNLKVKKHLFNLIKILILTIKLKLILLR